MSKTVCLYQISLVNFLVLQKLLRGVCAFSSQAVHVHLCAPVLSLLNREPLLSSESSRIYVSDYKKKSIGTV